MGLLDWLWQRGGNDQAAADEARVAEAIETAVRGVDPRIRLVSGYRERLEPAVGTALAYCDELIAALPDPLDASAAGWSADPTMRAFLARADDLRGVLARSPEVGEFVANARYADAETIFAVLTMVREQRMVLGTALVGDALRADVMQETVSFSAHRVGAPRSTEERLRAELESRAYEHLVIEALAQICSDQALADEPQRGLLAARLQLMRGARGGLDGLFVAPQESQAKFRLLREELAATEGQVEAGHGGIGRFDDYLERVIGVLANPDRVVGVERVGLWLDAMNIVRAAGSAGAAEVCVTEITNRAHEPSTRTVALIRFPRNAVPPRGIAWDEAARLLG